MRNLFLACFAAVIVITCSCASRQASSQPSVEDAPTVLISEYYKRVNLPDCTTGTIKTKEGALCGKVFSPSPGKNVNAYLGIPLAESTAGDNRWRAPVPVKPWKKDLKATQFGPSCPQSSVINPQSEDCLTINVWTPDGASKEPRAVMVFIYGGRLSTDQAQTLFTTGPTRRPGGVWWW